VFLVIFISSREHGGPQGGLHQLVTDSPHSDELYASCLMPLLMLKVAHPMPPVSYVIHIPSYVKVFVGVKIPTTVRMR
jgi:hypothetical protein